MFSKFENRAPEIVIVMNITWKKKVEVRENKFCYVGRQLKNLSYRIFAIIHENNLTLSKTKKWHKVK